MCVSIPHGRNITCENANKFNPKLTERMRTVMKRLLPVVMILAFLVVPIGLLPLKAQDKASTVTIAFVEGDPKTLDPQGVSTVDEFLVLGNVYEGLVTYDSKTLAPKPALAEKWDISK